MIDYLIEMTCIYVCALSCFCHAKFYVFIIMSIIAKRHYNNNNYYYHVTSSLQRIQNYAARVILRIPKSVKITTHLKSLHYLPVKVRRNYN